MMPGHLTMRRLLGAAGVIAAILPSRLLAQCPDGTPPPCRGSTSAAIASAARRPNPPLDERTWIVVPFENITHAPDIDWLKDASVNLLYLDMSKWRDIRVIDDERVADYIREVPEARGGAQLTLQSGMAVARRAGAGKLVMGDLLKVGTRTQLVAKVFDVRTGQRVRTVRQEALVADSIMPAFGQLARGVLNVEPPTGTALGAIGTTSLEAYQEYLTGVRALNAFNLPDAHTHFDRAIALDSSFALAHYKLTIVYGWEGGGSPQHLAHAQAAARLGTGLPARERSLIAGLLAQAQGDYGKACEIYVPMVRADSSDVEALYNFGECSYHDIGIVPQPGDSTKSMFRTSWNASIRAFRRVLLLDPSYHLAFQHIQDALTASQRNGCPVTANGPVCTQGGYVANIRRDGDTLVIVPLNVLTGGPALDQQALEARRTHVVQRNLEDARQAVVEWLQAGPSEARPKIAYGHILLRLGQVDSADAVFRQVTGRRARTEAANLAADRIEVAFKLGRYDEAWRLADSIRASLDSVAGAGGPVAFTSAIFGQVHVLDTYLAQALRGQGPPIVVRFFLVESHVTLGVPDDSALAVEDAFATLVARSAPGRAASLLMPTLSWMDFHARGNHWPVRDTASADPRLALTAFVAGGDTARLRAALAHFDSLTDASTDEPDRGFTLLSANVHLLLGDSAGALQRIRRFRNVTWMRSPMLERVSSGFAISGYLWPRMFLLQGDLAAAAGLNAEARDGYQHFLGMWSHPDPTLQPIVQRARDALARLGN